ncbi:hypothetical protein FOA52_003889 [Chlamydomonas sp. UWO 241]|nr:hypothetical protein FOA52_003889 [Chlamydomonas sp. UWO 241]
MKSPSRIALAVAVLALGCTAAAAGDFDEASFLYFRHLAQVSPPPPLRTQSTTLPYGAFPPPPSWYSLYLPPYGSYPPLYAANPPPYKADFPPPLYGLLHPPPYSGYPPPYGAYLLPYGSNPPPYISYSPPYASSPPPYVAFPPPYGSSPLPPLYGLYPPTYGSYPPPCIAHPPPYLVYRPPYIAYPPPYIAYPPPYVAYPPPYVAYPPPYVAYPPPYVAYPPPYVAYPPPYVAYPPPYVAYPPPYVAYPPPYGTYAPPYGAYPPPYGASPPADAFVPLPLGGLEGTPSEIYLPIEVVISLSTADCTRAGANMVHFTSLFADATAAAWNSTALCITSEGGVKCERTGDTTDISPSGECFTSSGRQRALLQGGATATVTARNFMPASVSESEASANQAAFRDAAVAAYTRGAFASSFGVTGAVVTILSPESSSSSGNALALGLSLGLGLGLGILLLAAIIAAVRFIRKRRRNQIVGLMKRSVETSDGTLLHDGSDSDGSVQHMLR